MDQELAKRQAKEELEEKMAAKANKVEALGVSLRDHTYRRRKRANLAHWVTMWQLSFAATQIQKVVRGRKGRVYAAGYRVWWEKQEAKVTPICPHSR